MGDTSASAARPKALKINRDLLLVSPLPFDTPIFGKIYTSDLHIEIIIVLHILLPVDHGPCLIKLLEIVMQLISRFLACSIEQGL